MIKVNELNSTKEVDLIQLGSSLGIGIKENLDPIHLGLPKVLVPNFCHVGCHEGCEEVWIGL
jgi:hypothetical protein